MAPSAYGVSFDPFASGQLSNEERAEIGRFIRVLDYEKHSGAEVRAVGCLMRLWNALEALTAERDDAASMKGRYEVSTAEAWQKLREAKAECRAACGLCSIDDGLVREWVMKARAVARAKGFDCGPA